MLQFGIFTNILCEVLDYLKSFDSDCGIISAFAFVDLHPVFLYIICRYVCDVPN